LRDRAVALAIQYELTKRLVQILQVGYGYEAFDLNSNLVAAFLRRHALHLTIEEQAARTPPMLEDEINTSN
jgi:hypothetical protein